MANVIKYDIEELDVPYEDVTEVLRCLLHSIVFHRALSQVLPAEMEAQNLNVRYVRQILITLTK